MESSSREEGNVSESSSPPPERAPRRETIAIHGGHRIDPTTKAVATPIYQSVGFAFDSAEHGAALFDLTVQGHVYTRIDNPTNTVLEERLAQLEGGVAALTVASGASAVHYAVTNLLETGTNIVSVPQLYGATYTLLAHLLPKQGVESRFARSDAPSDIAALIDANTRAVYCESVGNPAGNIADIEGLANVAHRAGVPLIVDNTVATPMLLRPIEYGADIVVHAMTKFMGGHGTTVGGAIVDAGTFDWGREPGRFHMLTEPEPAYHGVVYTRQYGRAAFVAHCRTVCQRNTGSTLAPFNAFLILQGLETLPLRMERHLENARAVAEFLRVDPRIAWVNWPGLPDSPAYPLCHKYLGGRGISLVTFGVLGGFEAGKRMFNALRLFTRMVNMGDTKSLVTHPASTTHRQLSAEENRKAGVRPEMIRLSVGIEHIDDILADLDQALSAGAIQTPVHSGRCGAKPR
ncbi:MAG: O-acetylhomoserine aminocarboxypropyltransferase/cysteine synthase family protein [Acetobacteraceae bacterium]